MDSSARDGHRGLGVTEYHRSRVTDGELLARAPADAGVASGEGIGDPACGYRLHRGDVGRQRPPAQPTDQPGTVSRGVDVGSADQFDTDEAVGAARDERGRAGAERIAQGALALPAATTAWPR